MGRRWGIYVVVKGWQRRKAQAKRESEAEKVKERRE